MPRKTPIPRSEKTLSRNEIQWIINLLNRHLEDLESLLAESEITVLERGLTELMKENYAHVRDKFSAVLENNHTLLYIKQPDAHPYKRSIV